MSNSDDRARLMQPGHHLFFNGGNYLRVHFDPTIALDFCVGISVSVYQGLRLGSYTYCNEDTDAILAEKNDGTPMRLSVETLDGQLCMFLTVPDQNTLDNFKIRLQNYRDGVMAGSSKFDWIDVGDYLDDFDGDAYLD